MNRCPKWARLSVGVWLVLVMQLVAQCVTAQGATTVKAQPRLMPPRFDHVVIVIEENKGYSDIIGKDYAPYINELAQEGASFTNAHGEWHPSQPNYLALFSGSLQGMRDDFCIQPRSIQNPLSSKGKTAPDNLASELREASTQKQPLTFKGYAEDMPDDWGKCYRYVMLGKDGKPEPDYDPNGGQSWVRTTYDPTQDTYVSKHVPWVNFVDAQPNESQRWTPDLASSKDYSFLPTISIVIPNDWHNMHPTEKNHGTKPLSQDIKCGNDVTLATTSTPIVKLPDAVRCGDDWLKDNISNYVEWAKKNNSLLIVTWDEDNSPDVEQQEFTYNQIPTIFVGAGVEPGQYSERVDHFSILRTLQTMYGLKSIGQSNAAFPITDVWQCVPSTSTPC